MYSYIFDVRRQQQRDALEDYEHDLSTAICCIFYRLRFYASLPFCPLVCRVCVDPSLCILRLIFFCGFIRLQTTEKLLSKRLSYHLASKIMKRKYCVFEYKINVFKKNETTKSITMYYKKIWMYYIVYSMTHKTHALPQKD